MLALVNVEIALALFQLSIFVIDDVLFKVLLFAFLFVNLFEIGFDFVLTEKIGVLLNYPREFLELKQSH